jgi:hypothetical protein
MQLIPSVFGSVDRRDPPLRERILGPCCRARPPSPPPGFAAETRTEDGPSRCSRPLRPARTVRVRPRTVRDTREAGPGPPRTPRRVARRSSRPDVGHPPTLDRASCRRRRVQSLARVHTRRLRSPSAGRSGGRPRLDTASGDRRGWRLQRAGSEPPPPPRIRACNRRFRRKLLYYVRRLA